MLSAPAAKEPRKDREACRASRHPRLPLPHAPRPAERAGDAGRAHPWPLGPYYPKAGPLGVLAIALAYFSLGVAVGARSCRPARHALLPLLVVPGVLAGLAFLAWVIRSLM